MYRFGGDKENARKIGERIMKVYKDKKVRQILQSYNRENSRWLGRREIIRILF